MIDYELNELIIEQTNDAIIYVDNFGNIQRWNEAASHLFGFSKEEALGENLNIIIPERARKAHWHGFDTAIKNGKLKLSGKPTLTRVLHKDVNKKLYVEMSFSLIKNMNGHILGSVAVARNSINTNENK